MAGGGAADDTGGHVGDDILNEKQQQGQREFIPASLHIICWV